MTDRMKSWLPIAAAIGAAVALVCILASTLLRAGMIEDTGATRPLAEAVAARLQALHPAAVDDAAFLRAAAEAEEQDAIAYVWLFTPQATILRGNLSVTEASPVESVATEETMRVLGALPEGLLDADQRLALLAASAMQAEGEHNDVFRHLVRELRAPDGTLAGWVGVTYDVAPGAGLPTPVFIAAVLVGLLALGVYWLSLPVWVWLDARQRGERAIVWAVFVLIGNLVALIAYLLARVPRAPAAAAGSGPLAPGAP